MKPKKWTDVYPHGTKEGDEELKFFISLARNTKYQWRSISAISKEAGLSKERVEEIMNKYYKKGMVFQNPKNEDQWGYWERVPEMLPKNPKSLSQKDQDDRINKSSKCSMGMGGYDLATGDDIGACVVLDPDSGLVGKKNILTRYGKNKVTQEHCAKQWGASGKNLNEIYKTQAIKFNPDQIVHHKINNDRKVFYVDVKSMSANEAENFIIRMKEHFKKNKEVKQFSSDEEYFRNKLFNKLEVPNDFFKKA